MDSFDFNGTTESDWHSAPSRSKNGIAIVALVLGIISILLSMSLVVVTQLQSKPDSVSTDDPLYSQPQDIESLIEKARASTVTVYCGDSVGSGWGIDLGDDPDSDKDDEYPNEIVTNYHVIESCIDGSGISFSLSGESREYSGELYSFDSSFFDSTSGYGDLAILMTDVEVPFLETSSSAPRAGDWVMAVGNPESFLFDDMDGHATFGHVSNFKADSSLIITDAAINRGNSGGPLINSLGQVIGTNSWRDDPSTADNMSYSIGLPVLCEVFVDCQPEDSLRWGK